MIRQQWFGRGSGEHGADLDPTVGATRLVDAWSGVVEGGSPWRLVASLPMRAALVAVGAVWLFGAVWSFTEQTAFAAHEGFLFPALLPLVIDGFAISSATVAWAASLDARPAIAARLATVVAVAASAASNGAWAYLRTHHDLAAVILGIAVPITANLAFEVLLAESRRQVQRRRGLPPPTAIPSPRLIRFALAPVVTAREWRTLVLELTRIKHAVASQPAPGASEEQPSAGVDRGRVEPVPADPARVDPAPVVSAPVKPVWPGEPTPHLDERPDVAERARTARPVARGRNQGGPVSRTRLNGAAKPSAGGGRRPVDPRVERLAAYLAGVEDADGVTGEMVRSLLDIDVAAPHRPSAARVGP